MAGNILQSAQRARGAQPEGVPYGFSSSQSVAGCQGYKGTLFMRKVQHYVVIVLRTPAQHLFLGMQQFGLQGLVA